METTAIDLIKSEIEWMCTKIYLQNYSSSSSSFMFPLSLLRRPLMLLHVCLLDDVLQWKKKFTVLDCSCVLYQVWLVSICCSRFTDDHIPGHSYQLSRWPTSSVVRFSHGDSYVKWPVIFFVRPSSILLLELIRDAHWYNLSLHEYQ